jgi:hypothetical protein
MKSASPQIAQVPEVARLLSDIRQAFASKQVHDGVSLMERVLELNVSWEALTQAVGEGISGPQPPP